MTTAPLNYFLGMSLCLMICMHSLQASGDRQPPTRAITAMLKPFIPLAVSATIGGFAWSVRTVRNDQRNAQIVKESESCKSDTTLSVENQVGDIPQNSIQIRYPLLYKKIKERMNRNTSDIRLNDLRHACETLSTECRPPKWGSTHYLECFAWMAAAGLIGHFVTHGVNTVLGTGKPPSPVHPAQLALVK